MQQIDIESIIRKYSQPIQPLTEPNQFSFNKTDYPSFNPSNQFHFKQESDPKMTQSYENKSSYNFNEPTAVIKYNLKPQQNSTIPFDSTYSTTNLNSNFSSNYHATSENNKSYFAELRFLKEIEKSRFGLDHSNNIFVNQKDNKANSFESQRYDGTYLWENPSKISTQINANKFSLQKYGIDETKDYSRSKCQIPSTNYFEKLNALQQNKQQRSKDTFSKNFDLEKRLQTIGNQKDLINVFNSQSSLKSTKKYPLYERYKYEHARHEEKPSIDFINGISIRQSELNLSNAQSNANNQLQAKPINEHFTPFYSFDQPTSLATTLEQSNSLPQFQNQPQQSKSSNIYKKLQSQISLKPNNQGFIPLHLTKQQIEYETCDINSVEMQEKKVYDRLEITGKMKSASSDDFTKAQNFCGWKNQIIYDIIIDDDNKKKGFWGKWC